MPYRDLFESLEGNNHDNITDIRCPLCGRELKVCRREYLHTMTKHRFHCKLCKVDISIKTEKEND